MTRELSVADELWLQELEPEVRALCERYIGTRIEAATQEGFNEGFDCGHEAGERRGERKARHEAITGFFSRLRAWLTPGPNDGLPF